MADVKLLAGVLNQVATLIQKDDPMPEQYAAIEEVRDKLVGDRCSATMALTMSIAAAAWAHDNMEDHSTHMNLTVKDRKKLMDVWDVILVQTVKHGLSGRSELQKMVEVSNKRAQAMMEEAEIL